MGCAFTTSCLSCKKKQIKKDSKDNKINGAKYLKCNQNIVGVSNQQTKEEKEEDISIIDADNQVRNEYQLSDQQNYFQQVSLEAQKNKMDLEDNMNNNQVFLIETYETDYKIYDEQNEFEIQEQIEESQKLLLNNLQDFTKKLTESQKNVEKYVNQPEFNTLLGPTGVGKSSTITFLMGGEFEKDKNNQIQIKKNNDIFAKIGYNNNKAETSQIQEYTLPSSKFRIYDTPGTNDTGGWITDISQITTIIKTLQEVRKAKIILLFGCKDIYNPENKNQSKKQLIKFYAKIFENIQHDFDKVFIIFTHCDDYSNDQIKTYYEDLQQYFQSNEKEFSWIVDKIIKKIDTLNKDSEQNQITAFKLDILNKSQKQQLLQILKSVDSIEGSSLKKLNISFPSESFKSFELMATKIQDLTKLFFSKKMYNELKQILNNLLELQKNTQNFQICEDSYLHITNYVLQQKFDYDNCIQSLKSYQEEDYDRKFSKELYDQFQYACFISYFSSEIEDFKKSGISKQAFLTEINNFLQKSFEKLQNSKDPTKIKSILMKLKGLYNYKKLREILLQIENIDQFEINQNSEQKTRNFYEESIQCSKQKIQKCLQDIQKFSEYQNIPINNQVDGAIIQLQDLIKFIKLSQDQKNLGQMINLNLSQIYNNIIRFFEKVIYITQLKFSSVRFSEYGSEEQPNKIWYSNFEVIFPSSYSKYFPDSILTKKVLQDILKNWLQQLINQIEQEIQQENLDKIREQAKKISSTDEKLLSDLQIQIEQKISHKEGQYMCSVESELNNIDKKVQKEKIPQALEKISQLQINVNKLSNIIIKKHYDTLKNQIESIQTKIRNTMKQNQNFKCLDEKFLNLLVFQYKFTKAVSRLKILDEEQEENSFNNYISELKKNLIQQYDQIKSKIEYQEQNISIDFQQSQVKILDQICQQFKIIKKYITSIEKEELLKHLCQDQDFMENILLDQLEQRLLTLNENEIKDYISVDKVPEQEIVKNLEKSIDFFQNKTKIFNFFFDFLQENYFLQLQENIQDYTNKVFKNIETILEGDQEDIQQNDIQCKIKIYNQITELCQNKNIEIEDYRNKIQKMQNDKFSQLIIEFKKQIENDQFDQAAQVYNKFQKGDQKQFVEANTFCLEFLDNITSYFEKILKKTDICEIHINKAFQKYERLNKFLQMKITKQEEFRNIKKQAEKIEENLVTEIFQKYSFLDQQIKSQKLNNLEYQFYEFKLYYEKFKEIFKENTPKKLFNKLINKLKQIINAIEQFEQINIFMNDNPSIVEFVKQHSDMNEIRMILQNKVEDVIANDFSQNILTDQIQIQGNKDLKQAFSKKYSIIIHFFELDKESLIQKYIKPILQQFQQIENEVKLSQTFNLSKLQELESLSFFRLKLSQYFNEYYSKFEDELQQESSIEQCTSQIIKINFYIIQYPFLRDFNEKLSNFISQLFQKLKDQIQSQLVRNEILNNTTINLIQKILQLNQNLQLQKNQQVKEEQSKLNKIVYDQLKECLQSLDEKIKQYVNSFSPVQFNNLFNEWKKLENDTNFNIEQNNFSFEQIFAKFQYYCYQNSNKDNWISVNDIQKKHLIPKLNDCLNDIKQQFQPQNYNKILKHIKNALIFLKEIDTQYSNQIEFQSEVTQFIVQKVQGWKQIASDLITKDCFCEELSNQFIEINRVIQCFKDTLTNLNNQDVEELKVQIMNQANKKQNQIKQKNLTIKQDRNLFILGIIRIRQISMYISQVNQEILKMISQILKEKIQGLKFAQMNNFTSELNAETIGALIIKENNFIFQNFLNEQIKLKTQNQNNIEYVLQDFSKNDQTQIKQNFKIYEDAYKKSLGEWQNGIITKNGIIQDIKQLASQFQENYKNQYLNSQQIYWSVKQIEDLINILALVASYWSVDCCKTSQDTLRYLHAVQATAIMIQLSIEQSEEKKKVINKFVEIKTGEGKSIVIGITAVIFALIGFEVNCCCYSELLKNRDETQFNSIFKQLELQNKVKYYSLEKLMERVINDPKDLRDQLKLIIEDNKKSQQISNQQIKKDILIIDEVDNLFHKDFITKTYPIACTYTNQSIKQLFWLIWHKKNIDLETVKESQEYKQLFDQNPFLTKLQDFFDQRIQSMLSDLKKFESHKYDIYFNAEKSEKQICYLTPYGPEINIVKGYLTSFAHIAEYENYTITENQMNEKLKFFINSGIFSYAQIPKSFKLILGVSGTINQMSQQIKNLAQKEYDIQKMVILPSIYQNRNEKFKYDKERDTIIKDNQTQQFLEIKEQIDQVISQNRTVLVFFYNDNQLQEFNKLFPIKNVQILNDKSQDIDFTIMKATQQGMATLCTRQYGRGWDFITTSIDLNELGGIHVIQAFFSEDSSEFQQIQGRTARQDQCGSFSLIINKQNILDEFQLNQSDFENRNSYQVIENIIIKLQEQQSQKIITELKESLVNHNKSVELKKYLDNFSQDNYQKITEILSYLNKIADKTENKVSYLNFYTEYAGQIGKFENNNKKMEYDDDQNAKNIKLAKENSCSNINLLIGVFYQDMKFYEQVQKNTQDSLKSIGYNKCKLVNKEKDFINLIEEYDQVWVISNKYFNDKGYEQQFTTKIKNHINQCKGLMIFADNHPFTLHANLILQDIDFGIYNKIPIKIQLAGNDNGCQILRAGKAYTQQEFTNHLITTGLNNIYEGNSICYPEIVSNTPKDIFGNLNIIGVSSANKPCIFVLDGQRKRGRIGFDCGFTKFMDKYWNKAGNQKFIQNIYTWLCWLEKQNI